MLGPNKDGTVLNIRKMNLVFDSHSCEMAKFTWNGGPTFIELQIGGNDPPYWNDEYDFCTQPWNEYCAMSPTI